MVTLVFSPRGIPANYRHMQGFGVNTYKWVNAAGRGHAGASTTGCPSRACKSLTAEDAANDPGERPRPRHQGPLRRHRARRLPRVGAAACRSWTTTSTPSSTSTRSTTPRSGRRTQFPLRRSAGWCSTATPENFFAENEQIAFGTGVLVDGLDFSDDKMLVGRTFSYCDTQRYRVGPNYLQLPVNRPKNAEVATNQRDGQMAYGVDLGRGRTRTSTTSRRSSAGCARRTYPTHDEQGPVITRPPHPQAHPADQRLPAGRRALPALGAVGEGRPGRQPGRRAEPVRPADPGADGLALLHVRGRARPARRRGPRHQRRRRPPPAAAADARRSREEEQERLANLGKNGPRDVSGHVMTHCVPNERVVVER